MASSHFSLWTSSSQPLSRPGPPILDCRVGTVHRFTYSQAAYDHTLAKYGAVYHGEHSFLGQQGAEASAIFKVRLHAALHSREI